MMVSDDGLEMIRRRRIDYAHTARSDRAIAAEIGVRDMTVGRARKKTTATTVAVEKRTSKDGTR